ncbi:MAG: hypothetical protein HXY24_11690 [Rubrivivax sp.]|nr:hypothetical protein [Rubrivivax sp.]
MKRLVCTAQLLLLAATLSLMARADPIPPLPPPCQCTNPLGSQPQHWCNLDGTCENAFPWNNDKQYVRIVTKHDCWGAVCFDCTYWAFEECCVLEREAPLCEY